jgi:alpha-L-rhamnosidase
MFNGTNAICDGVCARTPHTAAHATFYALYSGVLDGAPYKAALVEWLAARTAANGALGVPCGSYPVQFLLGGLYNADGDHGNAAFAVLTSRAKHSWMNMIEEFGASVTMECWLPEELENLSFSHVWSSSPSFTVPFLFFGIAATAPGYKSFSIKPQPGPVVRGAATLPTAAGPIAVAFEQGGEAPGTPASTMALRVEVPGGTVAAALLPLWGCGAGNITVTLDGLQANFAVEGDYARVDGLAPGVHNLATSLCSK